MPPEFTRVPQSFRYAFAGMKLNQLPDALPADKYAMALNIRALRDTDLQTRPGQRRRFTTAAHAITDINSYSALGTDSLPRLIARGSDDTIWLNPTAGTAGINIGSLGTSSSVQGASLLPFRPAASPNPYMYIANGVDYKKFSAPSATNAVTSSNVGIAEPQSAPDAALLPSINTTASMSETLRPTAFTNPDTTTPMGPGAGAFSNPGGAIAIGAPPAFAVNGPGGSSACRWTDIPAASFPYTNLVLSVDLEAIYTGGSATGQVTFAVEYSTDGGVTWPGFGLANIFFTNVFTPGGSVTRHTVTIALPPGTDLTQLQIRSYTDCLDGFPLPGNYYTVNIYDIKVVGENNAGFFDQTGVAADWAQGGTAGGPADVTGPGDTAVAIIADPNNASIYSIAYTPSSPPYAWQTGQTMFQGSNPFLVLDSLQPAINATIQAIQYFSGSTGRCVIVPQNLAVGGTPYFPTNAPVAPNFLTPNAIASIRRGAILHLGGSEYVYVLSVTNGPDNTICIETSTTGTFALGAAITAQPTLIVFGSNAPTITAMNAPLISSAITVGTGTVTRVVDFFNNVFSQSGLQDADYLHGSLLVDVPANLTEITLMFDVGDGSFTQDFYYYTIRPSDLTNFLSTSITQIAAAQTVEQRAIIDGENPVLAQNRGTSASGNQLNAGASQRSEFLIPVQALTRVGTGAQTLIQTNSVRVQVVCSGSLTLEFGSLSAWGGNQPDVGQVGSPMFYRVRPRSRITGVVGNPSPATRYGVNPLRFGVSVVLPSAAYDSQIDTWDIFRYGGSVTSWRYIGSVDANLSLFTDNYSDDAALAGDALDFDNFQPWPSIDLPLSGQATSVIGTTVILSTTQTNITKSLPGTLIQLNGQNVYTLRTRPTLLSGTTYLLDLVENAGALLSSPGFIIQEPIIAQQRLSYMWGPDASGTVFAVGDSLRPGNVYFAKNYNPDSAPDSYNIEIVPASEPLLGGEILDELSFVASPERWFALYPQPENPAQRYSVVQQPFLRGLAAPFGHCNDGIAIYWWAKDGIYSSTKGSLTDADLYSLFPHEGVVGVNSTYAGQTVYAPDYSRCGKFRLTFSNGYLYALYQDSTGTYRTLVLDTIDNGWSLDVYNPIVSAFYHPLQPASTLASAAPVRYDELVMGNVSGNVCVQEEGLNDDNGTIPCVVASFEFDGGDTRAPKQWGDFFMDLTPAATAGVTVTPTSLGQSVTAGTVIASSAARTRKPVSVGGLKISDFLGIVAAWTDDYSSQTEPTKLHLWQPSFIILPATDIEWQTIGSAFGLQGYMHVRQIAVAWISTAAITLTPLTVDGQAPLPIVIPSSGGAYTKQLFPLSANKGQLFNWKASSTAPFQLFFDDFEVHVGQWARQGEYQRFRGFGGRVKEDAPI